METKEEALFRGKEVTDDVKRKVLASRKAHEMVKQLLDGVVAEDSFIKAVYFLTTEHYDDVAEERAILNLCGYPVCGNKLKNIPTQQYKISSNKVYDITQRKNFCSGRCYKSNEHVKEQILPTPLWLRDPDSIIPVSLDRSATALIGEEVNLISTLSNEDAEWNESKASRDELSTAAVGSNVKSALSNNSNLHTEDYNLTAQVQPTASVCVKPDHKPLKRLTSPRVITNRKPPPRDATKEQHKQIVEKLLGVLKEWLTTDSLKVLGYVTRSQEQPKGKTPDDYDVNKANKLKLLEERMNRVVLGDKHTVTSGTSHKSEKEAMYVYTQRVEQFYKGQMEFKERVRFKEENNSVKEAKAQQVSYPHVDSKDQIVIRRKILHQKLAKVIQDLLPSLHLSVSSRDLRQLVSSFNLTSNNAIMRTNEYPLMGIILLQLMSHNNGDVIRALVQSQSLINRIVSSYNISTARLKEDIDALIGQF